MKNPKLNNQNDLLTHIFLNENDEVRPNWHLEGSAETKAGAGIESVGNGEANVEDDGMLVIEVEISEQDVGKSDWSTECRSLIRSGGTVGSTGLVSSEEAKKERTWDLLSGMVV